MTTPPPSPPVEQAPVAFPPVADVVTDHEFDLVPDTDHCRQCGHGRFARQHQDGDALCPHGFYSEACGDCHDEAAGGAS